MKVPSSLGNFYIESRDNGSVLFGCARHFCNEPWWQKACDVMGEVTSFTVMDDLHMAFTGYKEETTRDGEAITMRQFAPKPIFTFFGRPVIKRKLKTLEQYQKAMLKNIPKYLS